MSDLMGNMQALGIELPSGAYVFGMIVFSLIGLVAYRRGKQREQPVVRWAGLALMLYPYAVSSTWLLYLVGVGLTALAFVDRG
jgi:apolipoprotein N-acyltransferase